MSSRQHTTKTRARAGWTCALLVTCAVATAPACSGSGGDDQGATEAPAVQAIDASLATTTWPVRMADAQARSPFETQPGWASLFQRDHAGALAAFGADPGDGRGLARTHLELAALYRQAALLAARSAAHVYGDARVPQDPAEVGYLEAVGRILDGDTDAGLVALGALPGSGPAPLQAAASGWKAWAAAGATWPPDELLTDIPGAPGEVTPGSDPGLGSLPQFELVEQSKEARTVEAADPTSLYLLSRWHEAAARAAAPEGDAAVVTAWLRPWLLPAEPVDELAPTGDVADAWLFGGFILSPSDLPFIAAAATDGVAAVTAHQATSPLAAVVAPAIVDGQVVPDRMLDQAAWLGQQLEAEMARVGGGEEAFHAPFAQIARVAALRAGMIVADANGQFRDAGVLRINALDRSSESAADPVFLASVAAWDAGNKNALRAQELVHRLTRRYPPVEAVRYPLDALHIRLSRNAAPAAPVH